MRHIPWKILMENHMENNHVELEVPTIKPQTLECVLFFKVEPTLMKNLGSFKTLHFTNPHKCCINVFTSMHIHRLLLEM